MFKNLKVPEQLENDKENVYITSSSPQSAYKAYLNQFQRDFTMFLRLRSEEVVSHGGMVLTFIGRNTRNDPLYRDCCHFWTLLSKSLRDLVFEVYIIYVHFLTTYMYQHFFLYTLFTKIKTTLIYFIFLFRHVTYVIL